MSGITVKFERTPSFTHTFENVVNVAWSNEYAREFIVDQTSQVGHKVTNFTVNGFVKQYGDPSDNVAVQQALEDSLRSIGTGTLSYTGATDIPSVRFVSLDFREYRGSPVGFFVAEFVTEAVNVHAHTPVSIGSQAITVANGFELPQVEDSIAAQGPDEQMNNLLKRSLTISGRMVGSLTEVNTSQASLIAAVENQSTIVVVLSDPGGGVSLTIRPQGLTFGSPEQRGSQVARTYRFQGNTHDDYTKEPYTIGHTNLTFGLIQIDVVDNIKHTIESEHETTTYRVLSEKLTVSGKRYFTSWTAYNTFVQSFTPLPVGVHFYGAPETFQQLELKDINIGELSRDGNFSNNDKRYSASIGLTFEWFKNLSQISQNFQTILLGISWFKVINTTHGFTLNALGDISSRTVTLTGQILDTNLAAAKALLGTATTLGDPAIPGGASNYYISSLNINRTDTITTQPGNAVVKVHDVSVTANQLDTAAQKAFFLTSLFGNDPAEQILFDKVTSQSKSLSNRWVTQLQKFKTTSANFTISGEIWENDVSGSPANKNRALDFFNLFDAAQESDLSGGSPATYPAATHATGQFLPTNYIFFVTNINVGEWVANIKPTNPSKGSAHWRQTVSISATAVFDLQGTTSNQQPDFIDTTSFEINDQTTDFVALRVMGFGTVFKAVGVIPSTSRTTITRQFVDKAFMDANPGLLQRGVFDPSPPADWGFTNFEQEKDTFSVNGLTARWIGGWKATEEK